MVQDEITKFESPSHRLRNAIAGAVGDVSEAPIPMHNEYKGIEMDTKFEDLVAYGMMAILFSGYIMIPFLATFVGGWSIIIVMGLFFGYAIGMEFVGKIMALEEASSHIYLHATMRFPKSKSITTQLKISDNLKKVSIDKVRERNTRISPKLLGKLQELFKDEQEKIADAIPSTFLEQIDVKDASMLFDTAKLQDLGVLPIGDGANALAPHEGPMTYKMKDIAQMSDFFAAGWQLWYYENPNVGVLFIVPAEFEAALGFRDDKTFVRGQIIEARVAKASFLYLSRGQVIVGENLDPAICDIMLCTDCDFFADSLKKVIYPSSQDIRISQLALDEFQCQALAGSVIEYRRRLDTTLKVLNKYKRNYFGDLSRELADMKDIGVDLESSGDTDGYGKWDIVAVALFVAALTFLVVMMFL